MTSDQVFDKYPKELEELGINGTDDVRGSLLMACIKLLWRVKALEEESRHR